MKQPEALAPGVRGPWLGRITLLGPARRIPAR
jgi:hypothetical protein